MSSSAAELGPNKTGLVQFHLQDWAEASPDDMADYTNITAPLGCIYEIPRTLLFAIGGEIGNEFNIKCSPQTIEAGMICYDDNGSDTGFSSHLGALLRNGSTSMDTITNAIESLSMRITTEIRKRGRGATSEEEDGTVEGDAWANKICVRVEWAWLALPSAVFGLCILLLLSTIAKDVMTSNSMVWKSSVLPIMLRDVPDLHNARLNDIEDMAKGMELRIQKQKQE